VRIVAEDMRSGATPPLVSGVDIRTFLFADMRGYTRFTQEHGDDMASALAGRFADLVRETVPAYEGELLELRGDEALCVFRSARQALRASVELQRRLRTDIHEEPAFPLGVGMGLDAGEAVPTQGGYRGASLNLAARLCALAKPGEILATEGVSHLAHRVEGLRLLEGRSATVKGMTRPVRYVVVKPEEPLPPIATTAPLRRKTRARVMVAGAAVLVAVASTVAFLVTRGGETARVAVRPDSVAVLNANGGLDQVRGVGGTPGAVAIGDRRVWISRPASGDVLEFDAASGNMVPIHLGGSQLDAPQGLAFGDGGLWVANAGTGTVSEINTRAGRPVTRPLYVGNGPSGVAVTPGAVWVTLSLDGALVRINPAGPSVTRTIAVGPDPTQVVVGDHQLWVTNESAGTVTPVDLATHTAGAPIQVGPGPNGIAFGSGAVWVTSSLGGTVTKINPNTDRPSGVFAAGSDPEGIVVSGPTVWVAARGSQELLGLSAVSGSVVSRIRLSGDPLDVATLGGRVVAVTSATPGLHRGGTLKLVTAGLGGDIDPDSLDAAFYTEWEPFAFSYDGLVAFKRVAGPDGENVVPDLATVIPAPTNNNLTYTFHLRSGVRYSNGRLVRPQDLRYGLERVFRIANPAFHPQLSFYDAIRGADTCLKHLSTCDLSSGIQIHGSTITFHLTHADPDFLAKLAMPFAAAVPTGTPMRDLKLHPLPATGPYQVAHYGHGMAVWVRNRYFRQWSADAQPAGYPDKIVMRAMPLEQQVSAIESGSADLSLDSIPSDRAKEVSRDYPTQLHPQAYPQTDFINLDIHRRPFTDARARRALAFAIDRAAITRMKGDLNSQPTCQIIPPNFPGYRPYCPWSAPNIDRARHLVRHSGTAGEVVRVCVGNPADPQLIYVTRVLQGIGYHPVADATCKNDAVSYFGWLEDYPGANDFLDLFGCPGPLGCELPWVNRRIRGTYALQAARTVVSVTAWSALDRAITDQAPMVPIDTQLYPGFTSRGVGNYQYSPAPGNDPLIDQMWVR
jgi:ABC-type transport system substrate-binding protein/class 3 adenylate cyclase/DNA-binding beta-propeller fold protein YncE